VAEYELLEKIISRHSALFGQSSVREITVLNTSSFNLVFFFKSADADFVLKVMKKGAKNEFLAMQEAGKHVVVPDALSYGPIENDEYLLMKRAKGRDAQSILQQMDKTTKANFVNESAIMLARLHRSTWNIREANRMESTRTSDTDELRDRLELADMKAWSGISVLKAMEPEQMSSDVCMIHGRYCPSNIMLSKNTITGIVDWPDARWSTPGVDLGFTLFMYKIQGLDSRMFLRSYLDEWTKPVPTDLHTEKTSSFPNQVIESLPFFETLAAVEMHILGVSAERDPRVNDILHNPSYGWALKAVEAARQITNQLVG
jgi:aminoglycoside phosphotransferase (APT) family kinase protein